MLPAAHRLRRRADIARVLRHGKSLVAGPLRIYYLVAREQTGLRVACVVGKKVSRDAVGRHRYQRWLREIAAELLEHPPARSYDMVWVGLPTLHRYASWREVKTVVWPALQTLVRS